MSVWLVTPAHGRHEIARVVYKQRRWMIDTLAERGIEARCVVIAEDHNLKLAAAQGLDTIRRANNPLGAKFNTGFEYALANGATHVNPTGSDDWVHPDYLTNLPRSPQVRTTSGGTVVTPDGKHLAHVEINYRGGSGGRVYPAALLTSRPRPCEEHVNRACDTSILRGLERANREPVKFVQYRKQLGRVGFKTGVQLNPYLGPGASKFQIREDPDPWATLAALYPDDLVDEMRQVYASGVTLRTARARGRYGWRPARPETTDGLYTAVSNATRRPTVWFVVPAHGRHNLAAACLRQLRRTCDQLTADGVEATAVVVADDENLDTAAELGFGTVRRDNRFLSRRFNDGIQLACDPKVNPRPADYIVTFGSDNWIDPRLLRRLPADDTVLAFRNYSVVREDAREIRAQEKNFPGGVGVRVYPARLMAQAGYRPADEDRSRGCDMSILLGAQAAHRRATGGRELRIVYGDVHDRQIVDWKNPDVQINSYRAVSKFGRRVAQNPFGVLAGVYPAVALDEMAAVYDRKVLAAA